MANNPRAFDARAREARQLAYEATPLLKQRHPKVAQIGISLQFVLPEGTAHSSPHRRLFMPDMQAFFDVQCPDRECSKGGFDLDDMVESAIRSMGRVTSGRLECKGRRSRQSCGIMLDYVVSAEMHAA